MTAAFLRAVRSVENGALALLLGLMILAASANIVMRNFLGGAPAWADELLRALVLWIGLLGAMVAARENSHLNIDLFSRVAGPKANAAMKTLASAFTALVSGLVAYGGYAFVASEYGYGATMLGEKVPAWTVQAIIPLAFSLIALRYLGHAAASALQFIKAGRG